MSKLVGALLLSIYLCSLVATMQLSSLDVSGRSRSSLQAKDHHIRAQGLILDIAALEYLTPSAGTYLSLLPHV
jgi:hypothetical protein